MTRDFDVPLKVATRMAGFDRPWFVVGGWAIDLFMGRETCAHHDVEIGVFRADQRALYEHLAGWRLLASIDKAWQPWQGERIALQRSHALLSDTAQLFDALDARSNFEPIMQSVRDLNKLDDS